MRLHVKLKYSLLYYIDIHFVFGISTLIEVMDDRQFFSRCDGESSVYLALVSACSIWKKRLFPGLPSSPNYTPRMKETLWRKLLSKNTTQWRWLDLTPGGDCHTKRMDALRKFYGKEPRQDSVLWAWNVTNISHPKEAPILKQHILSCLLSFGCWSP